MQWKLLKCRVRRRYFLAVLLRSWIILTPTYFSGIIIIFIFFLTFLSAGLIHIPSTGLGIIGHILDIMLKHFKSLLHYWMGLKIVAFHFVQFLLCVKSITSQDRYWRQYWISLYFFPIAGVLPKAVATTAGIGWGGSGETRCQVGVYLLQSIEGYVFLSTFCKGPWAGGYTSSILRSIKCVVVWLYILTPSLYFTAWLIKYTAVV